MLERLVLAKDWCLPFVPNGNFYLIDWKEMTILFVTEKCVTLYKSISEITRISEITHIHIIKKNCEKDELTIMFLKLSKRDKCL